MASKLEELPPVAQAVIVAIVPVLLVGVVFWYFIWPLAAQATAKATELENLRVQNLRNRAFEHQRTEYLRKTAELEKELAEFRSIVPDEPAADELVKLVREAEQESSVHVRSFIAQPLVSQELFTEMPFKMRLDGSYYALVRFFNQLAQAQRIVGVSNLAFGPPTVSGGKYTVDSGATVGVNCVLTSYFNRLTPQPQAPAKRQK